jgi:hypothetical protein
MHDLPNLSTGTPLFDLLKSALWIGSPVFPVWKASAVGQVLH